MEKNPDSADPVESLTTFEMVAEEMHRVNEDWEAGKISDEVFAARTKSLAERAREVDPEGAALWADRTTLGRKGGRAQAREAKKEQPE